MTQDEIIEMVREADLDWHTGWTLDEEQSNRFEVLVKLVAAKEREACAELRNMLHAFDGHGRQEMVDAMNRGLDEYQALIKARGQA